MAKRSRTSTQSYARSASITGAPRCASRPPLSHPFLFLPAPMQPALLAPEPPWLPELLQILAERDMLSRPQLAALVGRARAEVDPVVAVLVSRGHVGQLVGDVTRESGLKLNRKGARYLAELTGLEAPATRVVRATTMLAHELMVNDLAVVAKLLDDRGLVKLLRFETSRDALADAVRVIRGRTSERIPLVADALVVLAGPAGPTALLVEIDMGTVSFARMRKRYEGYAAWWRSGGPERRFGLRSLRLVTVANHKERAARLRDVAAEIADSGSRGLFWFASNDVLDLETPERLLEPRFRTLVDDAPHALFRTS